MFWSYQFVHLTLVLLQELTKWCAWCAPVWGDTATTLGWSWSSSLKIAQPNDLCIVIWVSAICIDHSNNREIWYNKKVGYCWYCFFVDGILTVWDKLITTSRIIVIAFIGWCRLNQLILAISAGEMPLGSPPPFAVNAQINSILSFLASLILSGLMYFFCRPY